MNWLFVFVCRKNVFSDNHSKSHRLCNPRKTYGPTIPGFHVGVAFKSLRKWHCIFPINLWTVIRLKKESTLRQFYCFWLIIDISQIILMFGWKYFQWYHTHPGRTNRKQHYLERASTLHFTIEKPVKLQKKSFLRGEDMYTSVAMVACHTLRKTWGNTDARYK